MLIPGGRPVVLLFASAAVAAGVVLPHRHHPETATAAGRADVPALSAQPWNWSLRVDGGDTIEVRSRRCPGSHPRKVGSFSYRTVRVTNGKTVRHSATGSLCTK
jgi:hypothetical protein